MTDAYEIKSPRIAVDAALRRLWRSLARLKSEDPNGLTRLERDIELRLAAHAAVVREEELETIEAAEPPNTDHDITNHSEKIK